MNCHCVRETEESPAKNDISVYSEIVDLVRLQRDLGYNKSL